MNSKKPLPGIQAKDIAALPFNKLVTEIEQVMTRLKANNDFYTTASSSDDLYFLDNAARWGSTPQEREELGKQLTVFGVAELYQQIWRKHSTSVEYFENRNDPLWSNMSHIMVVMWNVTDKSTTLCQHSLEIGVHKDTLCFLKHINPQTTNQARQGRVVKGLMGILHNMLHRVTEARQPIRDEDGVNIIQRFRQAPEAMISCKALIIQAYLMNEEENEALNSDEKTFQFLHSLLLSAIQGPEHRSPAYGFHAEETLVAVNKLAANDKNKQRIVQAGFLPEYVRLLQPGCSHDEQIAAAQGLWTLTFKCWDAVRHEPGCVDALKMLAEKSSNESVRSLAKGALWQLTDEQQQDTRNNNNKNNKYAVVPSVDQLPTQQHKGSKHPSGGSQHVFISYQWESKQIILLIRDRLKAAGFNIWVDVDNMCGSVLEAMAEAVEDASVVLVCLTQKYKESPNCRTEAEYTFRRHKPIIPLRLENKYYPDGWLGALCGNHLVYDFSVSIKYDDSFTRLITVLRKQLQGTSQRYDDTVESSVASSTGTEPTHQHSIDIKTWKTDDVVNWLKINELKHLIDWFRDYDGSLLMELMIMKQESPDSVYTMLRDNKFTLTDILRLNRALKQISY